MSPPPFPHGEVITMSRVLRLLQVFLAVTGIVLFSGCYTVISHTDYRDALFQRWPEDRITVYEGGTAFEEVTDETVEYDTTEETGLEGLSYEGVAKSLAGDEYEEEYYGPYVTEESTVMSDHDTVTTITYHYYHDDYPTLQYSRQWYDPWWYDPYRDISLRPWYGYYPRGYVSVIWDPYYYDPWYWDAWYWGPGVCYDPYYSYYSWHHYSHSLLDRNCHIWHCQMGSGNPGIPTDN